MRYEQHAEYSEGTGWVTSDPENAATDGSVGALLLVIVGLVSLVLLLVFILVLVLV